MMPTSEAGNLRQFVLLAVLAAVVIYVYPLSLGVPLFDPDEGFHASVAQEMVERGDWVTPSFCGKPFLDKPILYFWSEALSLRIFGFCEAAVRLPGLMFGLLGAVTTAIVAWRMFGQTIGMIAGIFYATMILPAALAQAATHDVALIPWMNLALLLFWESDRATSRRASVGYTLAIGGLLGLTILTKGLVGVALVGTAYGAYLLITRRLTLAACLRGVGALVIAVAVASTWYIAVELRHSGYLYYYFAERHLLGFATDTQTHGDEPWWFYLPVLIAGGLPWIGYLPIAAHDYLERRKKLATDTPEATESTTTSETQGAIVLLWCWMIGCTLLLSVAHSKMVTYIWPVFPAVAILAALGWGRLIDGTLSQTARRALMRTLVPSCIVGPVILPIALFVVQGEFSLSFSWPVWLAAGLAGAFSASPLWFLHKRQYRAVFSAVIVSIVVQFAVIITFAIPPVAAHASARELAQYFNAQGHLPSKLVVAEERIGSLVFYLDPQLRAGLQDNQLIQVHHLYDYTDWDPEMMVAIPMRRMRRVEGYVDLKGVPCHVAGQYRLYRGPAIHARLTAAEKLDAAKRR